MKIAIYGRSFDKEFTPYIRQLLDKLKEVGATLLIFEPFYQYLSGNDNIALSNTIANARFFTTYEELKGNADFLFSIGGDGTLLDTTTFIRDSKIPIMGINTGRLGFLSSIGKEEIDMAIEAIANGNYIFDKRTLLKLDTPNQLFRDTNFALNDLTIHKQDSSAMITIHAFVNGNFLNTYWADGLIVATSTGSTAYSLSCGGPIVVPGSENFVITPVAPHNLNVRPIVVPDSTTITLKVEGRAQNFLISLDSRSKTIDTKAELTITKNDFHIHLLCLKNQTYLDTIRNKLMWGLDMRN